VENDKPLVLSEIDKLKNKYYPYLKEIRKRILSVVYVFIGSTFIGFIFYKEIIRFVIKYLNLDKINIVFTSAFQFFNLSINCGVAVGIVIAFPFLIYQIYYFLKPALKKKEHNKVTKILPFSIFLFLAGFIFGAIIMRWQIEESLTKSISLGIGNMLDITKLLSTILLTSALMGACFQFPIILLLLVQVGLVDPKGLAKKRSWVYLGIFLFSMFFPVDSIFLDVLLSLPLIFLYESSLVLSKVMTKKEV
jgi:sec-independent protein translocase protein TatC